MVTIPYTQVKKQSKEIFHKVGVFGRIRDMSDYIRKWQLLRSLRKAERIHSTKGSATGRRVLVSQILFIEGENGWKGLANKFNPYISFRLSHLIWWEKEYSKDKRKSMKNDYHDIYEVCTRDEYIVKDELTGFPSVSTPKAYRMRSFPLGFFQGLFEEHDIVLNKVWIFIGLIISFFAGAYFK